ncbi:MAG: rhodanese-like domain-containing protein [Bacteroidaceae bacterium]|nr:rhodanese-like domain-containing protein [Bacteroidaceae bacterium]
MNTHRNKGFRTISSNEFAQINGDTATVQLVDVRTKEEYEEGHILGALLIDTESYNFQDKATAQLSKEKPVAVYCRSGRRSASAASKLVKLGYEFINLDGGILAWQQAKMPIVNILYKIQVISSFYQQN